VVRTLTSERTKAAGQ